MANYLHGAYGQQQAAGSRTATQSESAIVYIGTAPVHLVEGGAENVNKPVLVQDISDARKYFGYSDDWAKYTLCEAMKAHFVQNGVGPLVLINVFDPTKHVSTQKATKTAKVSGGVAVVAGADNIYMDSVTVKSGTTPKEAGKDFTMRYDDDKKTLTIQALADGSLGKESLTVEYNTVDASKVTASEVVGASDGEGMNTGIYAVRNVYQQTGMIPSFLAAPGFSSDPEVHGALIQNSRKINGHWDAYVLADLPLTNSGTALTLNTAKTWKDANGYNHENETVYFPMADGIDGNKYHLSVLAAANLQSLLADQDGIPFRSASNTECALISNLWMGADNAGRIYDDEIINEKLCKNGIASAAYVGGRWALWGCHCADYSQETGNQINLAETNRMMLFYISNDFQHRRTLDVDKPQTRNDIETMISEEQTRLDALVKMGALTLGEVRLNGTQDAMSDLMNGGFSFIFNVTTTPLANSLTAVVNWTDEGYTTYFQSMAD